MPATMDFSAEAGARTLSPAAYSGKPKGRLPSWLESIMMDLLVVAGVSALIFLGIYEFQSWSQVDELWAFRFTPKALVEHPHFFRYLLMYPGFLMTEWGGEIMLSLYIGLFLMVGLMFMRRLTGNLGYALVAFSMFSYAFMHLFMNGRGAISWAAWVAAIYVIIRAERAGWRLRHGVLVGLSLLGSAVSTGVFAVVFAAYVIVAGRALLWKRKRIGLLALLIPVIYFSSFFIVAFNKNLAFFQSDDSWAIINMLDHGWGRFVQNSPTYAGLAVLSGVFSPFIIHYMLKRFTPVEIIILVTPTVGGAFGFTTLTLVVPSIILVFARRFSDRSAALQRRNMVRSSL